VHIQVEAALQKQDLYLDGVIVAQAVLAVVQMV
jgi:hypothetical protein